MREVKTAEIGALLFEATFNDGKLSRFEVSSGTQEGSVVLALDEIPALVVWLQTTVLGQSSANLATVKSASGPDPLAERKVINPTLSGVQVFDNSSKIINKDVIKFTIPGNKNSV